MSSIRDQLQNRVRLAPLVAFILFAVISIVLRIHYMAEPLERDITMYAVIGHELLHGRALYADLWDIKPPMIFWTFAAAELIAGYRPESICLLNVLTNVLSLGGIMLTCRQFNAARWPCIVAGLMWTLLSVSIHVEANQPNVEVFINTCAIWGFYLYLRAANHTPNKEWRKFILLAGFVFGIGSLYKHFTLVIPICLCAHALAHKDSRTLGQRFFAAAALVLPGVLLWGLVMAYFVANHTFGDFWDTIVRVGAFYARDAASMAGPENRSIFPPRVHLLRPCILLTACGIFLSWRKSPAWPSLLCFCFASIVAVAAPGKFYNHYFQLYLPAVCIGVGVGMYALATAVAGISRLRVPALAAGLTLITVAYISYHLRQSFLLTPEEISLAKYGPEFVNQKRLAPLLRSIVLPETHFYQYGLEAGLYYYTGLDPTSGMINSYGLWSGPLTKKYNQRVIQELKTRKPNIAVVYPPFPDSPVRQWVRANYKLKRRAEGFEIYSLHG